MRRVLLVAVAATVAVATGAALASTTKPAKIGLYKTSIGKILVCVSGCPTAPNGVQTGYTVYAYTKDGKNKNVCQNNHYCNNSWPPVVTKGKPIAGPGVKQSLLGRIKLKNGEYQVTYAGHAIYTYTGDSEKHETAWVNLYQFNGYWPGLNASGKELDQQGHPTTK